MPKKRWLNRTAVWIRVSWGIAIGIALILIGFQMEAWEGAWAKYAFIPGGTGVIILILDICSKFADVVDRRREV